MNLGLEQSRHLETGQWRGQQHASQRIRALERAGVINTILRLKIGQGTRTFDKYKYVLWSFSTSLKHLSTFLGPIMSFFPWQDIDQWTFGHFHNRFIINFHVIVILCNQAGRGRLSHEPDQGNLNPGVIFWILWIAADIRLHALMPFHNKFHPVTKLLPFINIIQRGRRLSLLTFITWNFIETHTNRKCHKTWSWPALVSPGSPHRVYWPTRACLGQQGPLNYKMTFWIVPRLLLSVGCHLKLYTAKEMKSFQSFPSIQYQT